MTGGSPGDGFAIRWVASSPASDMHPGNTLTGFSSTSTDPPASAVGNSVFFPATPVLRSFVYTGAPFSDPAFEFAATAACFLPGTRILTNQGEVPVEDFRVGDTIITLGGGVRELRWIGHGRVSADPGRRSPATPVITREGALRKNIPDRDLHVTKGHSPFLDDVLIPAEFLVNHRSILWNDHVRTVTVYHLELDRHDILIANGAPAESYRDDGNHWMFHNANAGWDAPPKPPCAPC